MNERLVGRSWKKEASRRVLEMRNCSVKMTEGDRLTRETMTLIGIDSLNVVDCLPYPYWIIFLLTKHFGIDIGCSVPRCSHLNMISFLSLDMNNTCSMTFFFKKNMRRIHQTFVFKSLLLYNSNIYSNSKSQMLCCIDYLFETIVIRGKVATLLKSRTLSFSRKIFIHTVTFVLNTLGYFQTQQTSKT